LIAILGWLSFNEITYSSQQKKKKFRKEIVVILDNLLQMPYGSCTSAFGVYKKAAVQTSQLSEFYEWSIGMGLCGSYEYPFVDRIPNIEIRALETFLSGMWQMSPSSSSPAASQSWSPSSESTLMVDDEVEGQLVPMDIGNSKGAALVRACYAMEPLIKFEDDENVSCWDDWEALLETSVSLRPCPCPPPRNFFERENRLHVDCSRNNGQGDETNAWKLRIYNPFCQPNNIAMASYHGSFANMNIYVHPCPWTHHEVAKSLL
jgi:hypothetical protein